MKIYWDETPPEETHRQLLERALQAAAAYANAVEDNEVSVSFVSATEIQKLNHDYRGKDVETDVLSFPGFPGGLALGDVVICLEVAKQQALEYNHSYERELSFLAVHGLLHLLGYDHETPQAEAEMCEVQEKIMQTIGVQR